jgi:hypothetical protein
MNAFRGQENVLDEARSCAPRDSAGREGNGYISRSQRRRCIDWKLGELEQFDGFLDG